MDPNIIRGMAILSSLSILGKYKLAGLWLDFSAAVKIASFLLAEALLQLPFLGLNQVPDLSLGCIWHFWVKNDVKPNLSTNQ